jgi:hypothetical protein
MTKKHHHSLAEAEEFTNNLIKAVEADIEENFAQMEPEDCVAFTRDFLFLMEKWQPEAIDLANNPLEGAAHGLYLAMMFLPCFKEAYTYSNRFLIARESLNNLKLDGESE